MFKMEFSPISMEMESQDMENRVFSSISKFLSDCDSDESSRDSGCGRSPTRKQLLFSDQKKKKRPALTESYHISNDEFDSLFSDNDGGISKWVSVENTMDVDDSSLCEWSSHMKRPKTSTNVENNATWNMSRITGDQDSFLSDPLPPFTKFSSRQQFQRRNTKKKGFSSYDSNTKENIPPNSPFYQEFMRQNQDNLDNSSSGSPFLQDYLRNEGHAAQIPLNSSPNGFVSPSYTMAKMDEKYIHEIDENCLEAISASASSQTTTKSSDCHIYRALSHEDTQEEMIGDFTRTCSLPVVAGKHADLKSITPHTLAAILQDEYSEKIGSYSIIDCRYPYEFDGGHIQNALNICTKDDILAKFFSSLQHNHELSSSAASSKSNILIFHCEFSSERAPKLMRFLRNHDRAVNIYPKLKYPEIYVLDGGYKAFFASHLQHCEPQSYKPMLHKDHANDLRHFRLKCKSWTGDEKRQSMTLTRRKTLRM